VRYLALYALALRTSGIGLLEDAVGCASLLRFARTKVRCFESGAKFQGAF